MGLIRSTKSLVDDFIEEAEENDFEVIPHRARIALASRFARQTVSSFGTKWPDVPSYGTEEYLWAIKHVEDFAAYAEPISNIETLQNGAIMSLGAIRRSIFGRGDDHIPTTEEKQFADQADDATKIVELALEITQSSPTESAGIVRIIYYHFMLLFSDSEKEMCESLLDDFQKLCVFSMMEEWDDNTLVSTQIFDREIPAIEEKSWPVKLIECLDTPISWRWFYGGFYIFLAVWLQFNIAPQIKGVLWYGTTSFALCWAVLGILILARSRWAIAVYLLSLIVLGAYAIYFGLVDEFTPNRIILLFCSLFMLYRYRDVADAVKK